MRIYSNNPIFGALNESLAVAWMCAKATPKTATVKFINEEEWCYARLFEWATPSMVVLNDTEAYPLKWAARVDLYNPHHKYDSVLYILV